MRRPRGPGGRFLTAAEIADMESKKKEDDNGLAGNIGDSQTNVNNGSTDVAMANVENGVKVE